MIENDKQLFEELNEELKATDSTLSIICAGGFILNYLGIRATNDIDSFFKTNAIIDSKIRKIGDKYGLNQNDELWLNNSIQNMNKKPPEDICSVLYDFSNLKVMIPPIEYVACMKLYSGREQDIQDVAEILKLSKIDDPETINKDVKKYGFEGIDESLILESFGAAYGMEWLEKYYTENEKRILERYNESDPTYRNTNMMHQSEDPAVYLTYSDSEDDIIPLF